MNILHFIFNLIEPKRKVTWLSSNFYRWRLYRRKNDAKNYRKYNNIPSKYFDVSGAGDICISESCHHHTGQVVGFSFGVEWSSNPFFGGVLGRDEAVKMAEFILEKCSEVKETMQEEKEMIERERSEYFKALVEKEA
jgi:hypothetical protein